jgi:archaellum biogenesis ATPase FlaH
MKCPNCQFENRDEAEFCGDCGKPLRQEIICPQCRTTNPSGRKFCDKCGHPLTEQAPAPIKPRTKKPSAAEPTYFADGRYQVNKFLGEGGKKKVYLAHDTLLDRDVAFALIKTENLNDAARERINREGRAMGRLGDHPNIGTVYDIGDHQGQPFIVQACINGGDVEALIEKAPDHRLPVDDVIRIARDVCKGLIFAHGKGIIHRDLKPGNVMLGEDGTAKIVDFGLAVAVDLSRITQSGMMVGTVSYMPPEQAMGGQVSEKADLYSLGAMLYEMVTGRPPFIGDDSVSIIGQHVNTPPISPTWHRADLPPALETLILQLLEKDPEKRPSSASAVLEAMESIDTGKVSKEATKEASTLAENPLYQKVFVGREPELRQLQSAFDGAISGQGALMMVVGEPGIGKTAICDQLRTYVSLRGGKALLGHCYEEGSLSLPYLAFVEAMRSYVLSREVKDLREELGTGAADVARIVSEVRDRLKVKPRPKGDPEEERYRLMQAVTGFLSNAAKVQPLLVVLEDLHDSDKGTLDMLTHVSRNLAGTRLLIVGTYRDVEVDRSHPLSAALAELRRVSTYGRVILRGLNPDEVRRMLESITREEIPWSLAEAVHRQTEGNPLFVQEVVRFLVEEGLLTQKDGRWRPAKDTPLEMSIPEGLRDVIGKRLSLLSKECNQLLSTAAVIGREFDLEILRAVTDIDEDAFANALNEAVQLSIIEERSQVGHVRYRFTHAFFRQTLYEELIAPRRLRLHQQVARALESKYASRLEEHATELAEHFSHSTDSADLEKAVTYSEMAARRAVDVYAYGEAVRLLDQSVNVQKVLDPNNKEKICDLLIDLCDNLYLIPEPRRILETEAPAALSIAESLGNDALIVRVCISVMKAIQVEQGALSWTDRRLYEWAEKADRHAKPDTIERSYIDIYLGAIQCQQGEISSGLKLLLHGMDLARQIGDKETMTAGALILLMRRTAPQYTEDRRRLAEEFQESLHSGLNIWTSFWLPFVADTFLALGQRRRAEDFFGEYRSYAQRTGNFLTELAALSNENLTMLMDGHLEDVIENIEDIRIRLEQAGAGGLSQTTGVNSIRAKIYQGKSLEDREREIPSGVLVQVPELCVLRAHLDKKEKASELLEEYVVKRTYIGTDEDETDAWKDVLFLEAAIIINHRKAVKLLYERLKDCGLYTQGYRVITCVPRHLGGAAALLGRYDESRQHYKEAIKVCTEMPFRPELALSRLQLAELILEHYPAEKKEALEHLDFAIKEFREMKMQPSLERALRHKDILKA